MPFYRVRRRLHETCYVERDCLVFATSKSKAIDKAMHDEDIVDEGEDRCQEPNEITVLGIVKRNGKNEVIEDAGWGNSHSYQCQNCDKIFPKSKLKEIENLLQRVAPGEPMPAGECPECGALCHPVIDE